MGKAVDLSQQYRFSPAIDVPEVLNRLEIQFIAVNKRRAIVIFADAIINFEWRDSVLTALERVEISVYDLPVDSNTDAENEEATELIEEFKSQLASGREITD